MRRPFFSSLVRSGRRYCSKLCGDDPEPESWKSMAGLIRCSANYAPLSPIGFLERSSKAYGDSTSLIYGSLRYTWAQTHRRCLNLASSLANQLGISRGDVVNLCHIILLLLLLQKIGLSHLTTLKNCKSVNFNKYFVNNRFAYVIAY